jgi:type IX secretion system PorP/SprF family membrane protein
MSKFLFFIIVSFLTTGLFAQDASFSISDFNPVNVNPAYAISGDGQIKLFTSTRHQWLNLAGPSSSSAAYRINQASLCAPIVSNRNNGFGISMQVNNQSSGEGDLELNGFRLGSAARFSGKFNRHNYSFASGVSFGISQFSLDWQELNFSSQYNPFYGLIHSTPLINPQNVQGNISVSANFGVRGAYSRQLSNNSIIALKGGLSAFHINNTAVSFFDNNSILIPRYVAHISSIIVPKNSNGIKGIQPNYLIVGAILQKQGASTTSEVRVGTNVNSSVSVYTLYRSRYILPLKTSVDALCFLTQIRLSRFIVSFGYDMTISKMNNMRTYGTAEIGLMIPLGGNTPIGNKSKSTGCQSEQILSHALWKINERFNPRGGVYNKEFSALSLVL